jgi:hypothetical protein
VAAGAVLMTAGVVGAPIVEVWPWVGDPSELGRLVLFLLLFGLGPAIAAVIASQARHYDMARRRVLAIAAFLGAVPPIVAGFLESPGGALVGVIVAVPWAAILAVPTLPVVRAIVEANESPSFDAFDRVVAVACGFLAAVKTPEALGALMLGEETAAAITGALATIGALGFGVFQLRRVRRATRARALTEEQGLTLEPELVESDEAALLSGRPRVRIVRTAAQADYRNDQRTELVAIVPEQPVLVSVRSDLWRLSLSALVAGIVAFLAVSVALIGRSF